MVGHQNSSYWSIFFLNFIKTTAACVFRFIQVFVVHRMSFNRILINVNRMFPSISFDTYSPIHLMWNDDTRNSFQILSKIIREFGIDIFYRWILVSDLKRVYFKAISVKCQCLLITSYADHAFLNFIRYNNGSNVIFGGCIEQTHNNVHVFKWQKSGRIFEISVELKMFYSKRFETFTRTFTFNVGKKK